MGEGTKILGIFPEVKRGVLVVAKDNASDNAVSADEQSKLDIEKLRAEIAELQLPFWKKPAYLGVFLPVGLAVITLLAAVASGYFDAERKRLEAEKAQL